MRHYRLIIFISFFLIFYNNASAYYYKQYTTSNSLISNDVYHCLLDSKGYTWFFTDKGVSKFDGVSFKNFDVSDGLGDHDIFFGYEDKSGRLWLYTANGNPCFIKNDTVYNAGNNSLLRSLPVISYIEFMHEDSDSSLYICYFTKQAIKIHKGKLEWILKDRNEQDASYSMYRSGDTLKLNGRFNTVSFVNDRQVSSDKVPMNFNFHDFKKLIVIDSEGLKIFNDHHGLIWHYNGKNFIKNNVLHAYYDENDHFFCCTNSGLIIFNTKTNKKDTLLDNIKVSCACQDLYGNYWITTIGNGIFYLNKNLDNIRPLKAVDNYKQYATSNGQIFFVKGSNVYYFNSGNTLSNISVNYRNNIVPLYIDEKYFFFNDDFKTYYLDRNSKKINLIISSSAKHIYNLGYDRFFMVGITFAADVYIKQNELTTANLINFSIRRQSCFNFNNSTLYFSDDNNIYDYDVNSKTTIKIDSLSYGQSIEKMYLMGNKLVVVSTGKNIILYDINDVFPKKELKKLPYTCYDISACSAGYILNTSKGYYITDKIEDITKGVQLLEYPIAGQDILSLNTINDKVVCNANGSYYFFNDSLLNKEKNKPKFFIEKVAVNGTFFYSDNIEIKKSNQAHLTIKLNSLKYNSILSSYEYRIIHGDTSQWYSTSYDKLDILLEHFGDYVIEVHAITENKAVSGSQYLSLIIFPPFYYSYSFYGLVAVFLASIIFFSIKIYHQHRVQLFQNELNYLQLEHRAINSLLNPHFIFNAINNIQNLININSKDKANNYLVVLSKLIRQNIDNLQFSFIPVSRELNLIRNYISLQNLRFDNKISLEVYDNSEGLGHIEIPPLLIHTFVENSVVHGFKKEMDAFTIRVDLNLSTDDYLIIKITDNGVGLTEKKNNIAVPTDKLSLGIDFIRKRLERISDFYKVTFSLQINNITDKNRTGTTVTIILYSKFKNEDKRI